MIRSIYPTDLTDEQWAVLLPWIPPPSKRGRPRKVDMREVVNAILYLTRTGCAWRLLPHDFPDHRTVFRYFTKWSKEGVWLRIQNALHERLREADGRNPEPSAAIIDSQSAKTGEKGGVTAVTTLERKSTGASVTLSWILWALSSGPWSIPPVSRIATARDC